MKIIFKYISLCFFLFHMSTSSALIIGIDFSATVNSVGSVIANGGINVGDTLNGYFVYDTDALDSNSNSHIGAYEGSIFSLNFDSGFHASVFDPIIEVTNDLDVGSTTLPGDGFRVLGNSSIMAGQLYGRDVTGMQFGLRRENIDGHLWGSDALPDFDDWYNDITLHDLNFPSWHWMVFEQYGNETLAQTTIRWEINDFSINIPEPGTRKLFLLSFLVLVLIARERHKFS